MKQYGLIGEKLTHSYSVDLHHLLGDYPYRLISLARSELDGFLKTGAFDGLNVTIPYKQAVMPYCGELSETARRVGSVNTLLRRADGSLYGDNTDVYGFTRLAQSAGVDFKGEKTLVLGSGGTSLTACYVIREAGGLPVVVSREGENNYQNLDRHRDAAYLVNATPVGMYPHTEAAPLSLDALPNLRGVLDVIYNPLRTRLMQQAADRRIPCASGMKMLVYQGVRASELFTGERLDPQRVARAEGALRQKHMNLVLTGMPGCGKTTVGKALQRLIGLPLIDLDREIALRAGMSIPEIFKAEGESGFRLRESQCVAEYGRQSGHILATGGGAVVNPLNREALRLNGFVVHLTRPLERLATGGRPLSRDREALSRLWQEREPLYRACADATIPNETTPEACARAIWEAMNETVRFERPQPEHAGRAGA